MDAISLALLSAVTEAVFGHLLTRVEPRVGEEVQRLLRRDPAKLAFKTALAKAYTSFDRRHHQWTASLFDQAFLCRDDVSKELSDLLTHDKRPDAGAIARAWADYFPPERRQNRAEEITPVVQDFLEGLKKELRHQASVAPGVRQPGVG